MNDSARKVTVVALLALVVTLAHAASGQTAGGAKAGGYSKVYEAAGGSPAARDLKRTLNTTLLRAVAKTKSFQAPRVSTRRTAPARTAKTPASVTPATTVTKAGNYAYFRHDAGIDYSSRLADALGTTQAEKSYLKQLFDATESSFEQQVAAEGGTNNVAAALTFFIAANVTVYHDDPEPSDAATEKLWKAMNSVFDETDQYRALTDRDKQEMYETLIAFGGLSLAGYTVAKTSNDAALLSTYRQLAGVLIQLVLKTSPDKVRFVGDDLVVG
jgi:hypothetical protein